MTVPEPIPGPTSIAKLTRAPSYAEFLETYLIPNKPVIIGSDLIKDWLALQEWTVPALPDAPGASAKINWKHLTDTYGHQHVSVSNCRECDSFGNLECETLPLHSVVSEWEAGNGQDLYVKDWHLARSIEASLESESAPSMPLPFYTTPDIFKDDWMNAYYTQHTSDDFRFVYVGAAGTYTPLHRDVYCSYSWSTNVCGRKRWWLFPPAQTPLLFIKERNVSVHDVRDVDLSRFPDFAKTNPIIVEQEAGETIFV